MNVSCPPNFEFRRRYAELLRQFISGRVNTDGYEDRFFEMVDRDGPEEAVWAVFASVWHLYDDITPHFMTDSRHRVSPELRRRVARWIVFLRSRAPIADVPEDPKDAPRKTLFRCAALALAVGVVFVFAVLAGSMPLGQAILYSGGLAVVGARLLALIAGDRALEPEVAARAFTPDDSDPWPFQTAEALAAAVARPTYLHG
jgi:hypothetical protein